MIEEMMTLKPCKFTFDDTPAFDGFDLGSTWNGFDNAVTPAVCDQIVAYFKELYGDRYEEAAGGIEEIEPDADGLVCLGGGFATQIVEPSA
jgi:hypothetical protein